jgi:hypothetical protein
LAVVTVWSAYTYTDATYVNAFEPNCIYVRDSMPHVLDEFLTKHPGCEVQSRGVFERSEYTHVECGTKHTPNGHVLFRDNSACEVFAALNLERKVRAVAARSNAR